MCMTEDSQGADGLRTLYEELLDLVPAELHGEYGEVFYSGASAFRQSSRLYLLGFNPGGDPSDPALDHYTIGADVQASREPGRSDWSGFDDDWRAFGPGAVAFQRRVRHLLTACGIADPRVVPVSNAMFVRSTSVETLDPQRAQALLYACWAVHERVITALGVTVVVCFGQAAGEWVRAQVGALTAAASDTFVEDNRRRWRSTTHVGRDGIHIVTLTHPSRADWTKPGTDPSGLVVRALERAGRWTVAPSTWRELT
ncbi:MAG: hypothetical protein ACI379_01100 [Nocardioides sp.]|uniref:hypothetical protein n=1 Tax=Nocardioides sp. TaxID=35761 RepID=UPI003F04716D